MTKNKFFQNVNKIKTIKKSVLF